MCGTSRQAKRYTRSGRTGVQAEATDESYKIHRDLKDEVISVAVSKRHDGSKETDCEG